MIGAPSGGRIYLDANIFIEALDGTPDRAASLKALFAACRERPRQAVTSELVLAEAMGKESPQVGWLQQSRFFSDLIVWNGFIDVVPVTRDILWATDELRRLARQDGRTLRLADAIHLATALQAPCAYFISSDTRLVPPPPMRRLDPHALNPAAFDTLFDA